MWETSRFFNSKPCFAPGKLDGAFSRVLNSEIGWKGVMTLLPHNYSIIVILSGSPLCLPTIGIATNPL